ncbi:hypothetical protein CRENBAI_025331 [Crenichthys baileyi]|uniref:Uncharacterized protein n=1 Tax=Crenichthys baileyi TaxID=28760 RepID=A0AAV9SAL5_9TELE
MVSLILILTGNVSGMQDFSVTEEERRREWREYGHGLCPSGVEMEEESNEAAEGGGLGIELEDEQDAQRYTQRWAWSQRTVQKPTCSNQTSINPTTQVMVRPPVENLDKSNQNKTTRAQTLDS